jgi:predicted metalloprotease with PDZ domain
MKKIIITTLTLLFAATLFAKEPEKIRRTVVVRDGKVIHSDNMEGFEGLLLGGPRAWLGVSLNNLTPELSEHLGGPKEAGVIVEGIADDSPAAKAGLRVGDIVLSIDGKDVKTAADVRRALSEKKDGESVRMDVQRGRSRQTVVATVKERPAPRLMQFEDLRTMVGTPEFRARLERLGGDCGDLQTRIKELETRLKELEKKLQR